MAVEITVLVDNEPSSKDPFLRTERGHSLHVRWNGRSLLLDTGITGLFADNARTLGIRVTEIDTVVLSHGHFDHSGGLLFARCKWVFSFQPVLPPDFRPSFPSRDGSRRLGTMLPIHESELMRLPATRPVCCCAAVRKPRRSPTSISG